MTQLCKLTFWVIFFNMPLYTASVFLMSDHKEMDVQWASLKWVCGFTVTSSCIKLVFKSDTWLLKALLWGFEFVLCTLFLVSNLLLSYFSMKSWKQLCAKWKISIAFVLLLMKANMAFHGCSEDNYFLTFWAQQHVWRVYSEFKSLVFLAAQCNLFKAKQNTCKLPRSHTRTQT